MDVAIIKYNAGNIYSVEYAMKRLGIEAIVTDNPEQIAAADKVIFPGQGEASSTMAYLREFHFDSLIKSLKQPVLGICIGMQLMCDFSEEGNVNCLGIFDAKVKKFEPRDCKYKVPHMGWNNLYDLEGPLFSQSLESAYVYFVHSYYVPLCANTIAKTDYIEPFSAALQKDNYYATQFHPEKSGDVGEVILRNFLNL